MTEGESRLEEGEGPRARKPGHFSIEGENNPGQLPARKYGGSRCQGNREGVGAKEIGRE